MENLQSARCSPFLISKVLAARMRKLITARARKNKRTARMLANARKDHSIPLNKISLQIKNGNHILILTYINFLFIFLPIDASSCMKL